MMAAVGSARGPRRSRRRPRIWPRAALSLARRFAGRRHDVVRRPSGRHTRRHVAVEFVHPVIVGKRALPAVHVEAVDVAGALGCWPGPVTSFWL